MSYKNLKETVDIVDEIDKMLEQNATRQDGEPNHLKNNTEQDPETQMDQLEDDLGGGEYEDEEEGGDISEAFNLLNNILDEQDSEYQKYFRGVMKKHGVTKIKTMSPEKKKEFFKDVSDGWRSRKKVKESENLTEDYKQHFKMMMKKHGVKNIDDLDSDEKKSFFNKVDASWKSVKEGILRKDRGKYEGDGPEYRRMRAAGGAYGSQKRISKAEKQLRNRVSVQRGMQQTGKKWKTSHNPFGEQYRRPLVGRTGEMRGSRPTTVSYKTKSGTPVKATSLAHSVLDPNKTPREKIWGTKRRDVSTVGGITREYNAMEQELYEEYKKYFKFLMQECGIEDFSVLAEEDQAEFYGLVNEAFLMMKEQMQRPGAPISNPMNTFDNRIDAMKNQLRPERRERQKAQVMAAMRQRQQPRR
jgi:hypothetical protein